MKTEIISRILISIIIFYLISKVIGPLLLNLFMEKFGPGKKNKKDIDLDMLIEKQKLMMKNGISSNTSNKSTVASPTKPKYSSRSEASFSKEYQKLSKLEKSDSRDQKLKSIKSILTLIDNLQWGEGKAFKEISEQLKNKGFEVNQMTVSRDVKILVENNVFLKLERPELPSFSEVKLAIKSYIHLTNLLCQTNTNGEMILKLNKELGYKNQIIRKAIFLELSSNDKVKNLENSLCQNFKIENIQEKVLSLILTTDKKSFQSHLTFIDNVKKNLELVSLVSPLTPIKNIKDISSCYYLLGLREDSSSDEIKKKYKTLALKLHPDKISSLKLSPKLEKTAASNFNIIKDAYDIIIKKKQ